jgi:hypothetical protein
LLVVEFASLAVELAHNRRKFESTFVEIDEVNTPLMRFGVIESECLCLYAELAIGTGNVELFEISVAVEKLFMIRNTVVFDPDIRSLQPFGESTNMCFPITDEKIEIVRSVCMRIGRSLGRDLRIRECRKRMNFADQERCSDER